MVKVGDLILINEKTEAVVTTLFKVEGGRWFIGYQQSNGHMGFFLDGDEDFKIIKRGRSNE